MDRWKKLFSVSWNCKCTISYKSKGTTQSQQLLRNTAINALRLEPDEVPTETMIQQKMNELIERENSQIEISNLQSALRFMIGKSRLNRRNLFCELDEDELEDKDELVEKEEKDAVLDNKGEGEDNVLKRVASDEEEEEE